MHIRNYYILWGIIALIYCCNLTIDVMEVDAAQYAAMSAEMQDNGSYLQVYHRGQDYLDKPPLLFWLSSASFSLFGVSNAAYKLPALLALLLGLWATYRFSLLYDKRETALMAVTILGSTQAFFLMTNDVRTDGLLTGFVMFTVYQCAAYLKYRKWYLLVFAGVGVGLAMLAKGPIGAIIPAAAIVADRVFKAWKDLFNPKWMILIAVALVLLLPMCYGLYTQFDLHPEKNVYGLEGPSGLRFFFWTQSFGRITGEIYWDNNAPWYYFLMTFLWDFMPWVIVFVSAFVLTLKSMRRNLKSGVEYFTVGGFVLILILLSLSRYKLPHYIFPLFPFAAIMAARYLGNMQQKDTESMDRNHRPAGYVLTWTQLVLMHVFYAIIAFGFLKAFSPESFVLPALIILCFGLMWSAFLKYPSSAHRVLLSGSITAIAFNLFLSLHFYPHLMQYQSGAQAGKVIHADKLLNERQYFSCPQPSYTLDFYSGKYIPDRTLDGLGTIPSGAWVFLLETDITTVMTTYPEQFRIVQEFEHYKVSMLKLKFVLAETRQGQLKRSYLLEKI